MIINQDVCVGIDTGSGCLGEWKTFGKSFNININPCLLISWKSKTIIAGNHVGDWEHVSLRLQRGQPVEMYLGVHRYTLLLSFLMFLQTDQYVTISQIAF